MGTKGCNILAISGSLRCGSVNAKVIRLIDSMLPAGLTCQMYNGLGQLPLFNLDLEQHGQIPEVEQFRMTLQKADCILFCTPEYAGGVPGALKNALDWVVPSGELYGKPVAVISASPLATGGEKAHASLLVTLAFMDAKVIQGGSLTIPFVNRELSLVEETGGSNITEALLGLVDSIYKELL